MALVLMLAPLPLAAQQHPLTFTFRPLGEDTRYETRVIGHRVEFVIPKGFYARYEPLPRMSPLEHSHSGVTLGSFKVQPTTAVDAEARNSFSVAVAIGEHGTGSAETEDYVRYMSRRDSRDSGFTISTDSVSGAVWAHAVRELKSKEGWFSSAPRYLIDQYSLVLTDKYVLHVTGQYEKGEECSLNGQQSCASLVRHIADTVRVLPGEF